MQDERTKKIITGLIVLVVLLLIVYAVSFLGLFGTLGSGSRNASVVSEVVREMFQGLSVHTLSGTVAAVSGNTLTLEVSSILGVAIPQDADLFRREVEIQSGTRILERGWKSDSQFAAEMRAYRTAGGQGAPPAPYVTHELSLSDLKVGDRLTVGAGGANIIDVLQITPEEITRGTQ